MLAPLNVIFLTYTLTFSLVLVPVLSTYILNVTSSPLRAVVCEASTVGTMLNPVMTSAHTTVELPVLPGDAEAFGCHEMRWQNRVPAGVPSGIVTLSVNVTLLLAAIAPALAYGVDENDGEVVVRRYEIPPAGILSGPWFVRTWRKLIVSPGCGVGLLTVVTPDAVQPAAVSAYPEVSGFILQDSHDP